MPTPSAAESIWFSLTGQALADAQILGSNLISQAGERTAGIDSEFFDDQVLTEGREHRCQHAFYRATRAVCSSLPASGGFDAPAIVVDLGCGRGALAQAVMSLGFNYVGVDASLANLRVAVERYPGAIFIHALSDDIPFKPSSVAAFVFANFLHHVPRPSELLRDLIPFLRPGGCIAGFEPNFLSPYGFLGWLKNFSVDRRIIQYNRWTLLRRFRNAGLRNVRVRGVNLFPCFFEGPRIERFYDFVESRFLNKVTGTLAVHQVVFGVGPGSVNQPL